MANIISIVKNTAIVEAARVLYWLTKPFFKKNIWIVSESNLQAQENGYDLYRWIEEHASDVDVYYVIDKSSPVVSKFCGKKSWLAFGTVKQVFYLFHANRIISTHGLWMIPDEVGFLKKMTRKTLSAKRIMLNHGLCFLKNGKRFYHKSKFPLNDLVMTLSPKHKAIFTDIYGYDDRDVVIAGFPRYDSLIDSSQNAKWSNIILFMPTFRDNEQNLGDKFKLTDMFNRINLLVNDFRIKKSLLSDDCHLVIYLHQNIQSYIPFLKHLENDRVKILSQTDFTVTELLKMSKLLITDYSSVLFDFSYMNKPFISYQFDYDSFVSSREDKAIIDMRTELPGDIVDTHEQLVDEILHQIKSGFVMKSNHKKMVSQYFSYQDQNNCARVYQAIKDFE